MKTEQSFLVLLWSELSFIFNYISRLSFLDVKWQDVMKRQSRKGKGQ